MNKTKIIKEKGIYHSSGITSGQILELLRAKHSTDVFVSECKNGQTWGKNILRLDAWALLRTWSPVTSIGYEIKVNRNDFENDQKWIDYTGLCNMFYFVCPAGLIRATDLPSGVGLLWANMDGTKLIRKRMAERKQPDLTKLNELMTYVIMARSIITANMNDNGNHNQKSRLEIIKENIQYANERKELSSLVKGHIRERIEEINELNRNMNSREHYIKEFENRLSKLGIIWDSSKLEWHETSKVNNAIEALKKNIDYHTLNRMEQTGKSLVELSNTITKIIDDKNENNR